jgi:hypothetical protein
MKKKAPAEAPEPFSKQQKRDLNVPFFPDPGSLALQFAQVVELGPTNLADLHYLDLVEGR